MEVLKVPNEKLRVKTRPIKKITPALLEVFKKMEKVTQSFKDPEGVGLASTQIGESEQYFLLKKKDGSFEAVINPKILTHSQKTKIYLEGCLSIPNYWGEVERYLWVNVSYTNIDGKIVTKKLTGLEAHIFQHECDHLAGILFVDHVLEQKNKLYKVVGHDRTGAEIFEEIKLEI